MMNSGTDSYRKIARAFSRKAQRYDTHAAVQKQLIDRLTCGLRHFPCPSGTWLDIGTGTAMFEKSVPSESLPEGIIGLDIASGSLKIARSRFPGRLHPVVGDMHHLPLKRGRVDRVIMTSALQWAQSPAAVLQQLRRSMKPGGQFVYAVFLDGYLRELREVYNKMGTDLEVYLPSLSRFESLLAQTGFTPVWSERIKTTWYFPSAFRLIRQIVAIGASARRSGSVHSSVFEICRRYTGGFGTPHGIPLSVDAVVGMSRGE